MSDTANAPGWDFSRLPQSEHAAVVNAYKSGDVRALIAIHDNYQLSPYSYCCDQNGLLTWFGQAIKNGTINEQGTDTQMAQ